tara:strand:- start:271 stop:408 length:138 start_codon:yes stop_codon:yes gene_type:complete
MRTPKHLLATKDNLELLNGAVAIKFASSYPDAFSEWYTNFQADYS